VVPLEPDSFSDSRVPRENNRDDPENLLRKQENFNRRRGFSKRLLRVLTNWSKPSRFFDLLAN
jgi:hypothetical protein